MIKVILSGFFFFVSSCSHIVPQSVRTMPIIRVSHKGIVENMAIETYVASVLAGEVGPSWPLEALKAQAIASRTFALKRMKERKERGFHVENSYMDQVFKKGPAKIFIQAVKETAGLVLGLNDELIESSFHSTCGGHTANSKEVWGQAYPYLRGVSCSYCTISPSFKWSNTIKRAELEEKIGKFSNIKVTSRSEDGRSKTLELSGPGKKSLSGQQFRMKISPLKVKSTLITSLHFNGKNLEISGQGFGHGVGLCQYGALGMAKEGLTAEQILAHYYPGTVIKKFY